MASKLFWRIYIPHILVLPGVFIAFELFVISPYLGLAAILSLLLILYLHSKHLTKSVSHVGDVASQLIAGRLEARAYRSGIQEVDHLATTMQHMAQQLDDKLDALIKNQKEREAILSGISEGLIAVDGQQRIIEINKAAAHLLKLDPNAARGKFAPEVIRSFELIQLVSDVISSRQPIIKELTIGDVNLKRKMHIRIVGNLINDEEGQVAGAVFILNDITRVRHLENIRRDFVSNVSHQLKTPITSIKGFVETILSGSVDNEKDMQKFLSIIEKHTNRLSSIIDDLLTLARLEDDEAENSFPITKEFNHLNDIIINVVELCEPLAKGKEINIIYDCPSDIRVLANRSLIEQAIINIVDNAIKYSERYTQVTLVSRQSGDTVRIQVTDQGPGIPPELQERIFERFYRIDKVRGTQEQGSGLGLAIVKHIAVAHQGKVEIESSLGKGSTFSLVIPTG